MTENLDTRRRNLAHHFQQELTEAANRRFGARQAAALAAGIASLAETLADVALVSLSHDDAEPDFIGYTALPTLQREEAT